MEHTLHRVLGEDARKRGQSLLGDIRQNKRLESDATTTERSKRSSTADVQVDQRRRGRHQS